MPNSPNSSARRLIMPISPASRRRKETARPQLLSSRHSRRRTRCFRACDGSCREPPPSSSNRLRSGSHLIVVPLLVGELVNSLVVTPCGGIVHEYVGIAAALICRRGAILGQALRRRQRSRSLDIRRRTSPWRWRPRARLAPIDDDRRSAITKRTRGRRADPESGRARDQRDAASQVLLGATQTCSPCCGAPARLNGS